MTPRRLVVLLTLSVAAGVGSFFLVPKPLPEISRQELITEVQSGYVHEVTIIDKEVVIAASTRRGGFRVMLRAGDNDLIDELLALGVEVKFETTPPGLI